MMCGFDEKIFKEAVKITDEIYKKSENFADETYTHERRIIWHLRRNLEFEIAKRLELEAEALNERSVQ